MTLLGNQNTHYSYDYTPEVLETFENKHPENEYIVTLDCPEFTSLCPKTGQPDFGHIIINYIPRTLMVESKSLKIYLFSFRNHGDFHEDCVNIILKDLIKLMDPKYIEVIGLSTRVVASPSNPSPTTAISNIKRWFASDYWQISVTNNHERRCSHHLWRYGLDHNALRVS